MATDFNPNILPDIAFHPGEFLRDDLNALEMTPEELARRVGQPVEVINDILDEKAMVTEPLALELERVLGTPAQSWLNLGELHRLVLENGGRRASDATPLEHAPQ